MAGRGGDQGGRDFLPALERALVPVARANPLVVLWRWRYETALAGGLWFGVTGLLRAYGPWWTIACLACLAFGVVDRPDLRRFVVARTWCVVTPHRVRTGCAQAWVHNRRGKIPAVLWTSARPYGERVVLYCRAGISAAHLEAARQVLAAACWATEVQVEQHPRHAHIVVLRVRRRSTGSAPL